MKSQYLVFLSFVALINAFTVHEIAHHAVYSGICNFYCVDDAECRNASNIGACQHVLGYSTCEECSNLAETYGTVWCHHTNENGTVYFNETTTSFCSNFMSCDSDIVGNPHPHTVKTHAHQCPEYEPTPCGYEANFWIDLSTWPISKNTVMCNRTYEDYLELPCFQIGLREGLIREIILARLGDHSGAYLDEISGDLVWNAENFIVNHCDGTLIGSDQVTAQTYFDEIKLWNGLNKCLVYGGHAKRSEKDELKRRHVVIPEDMGHSGVGVLSLGVLVLFIIIAI